MKEMLYIDGIDVFAQFGVVVTTGGYNDLFAFPELNDPEKNIWDEYDGIEVDLDNPTLKAKEVTIYFVSDTLQGGRDFITFLSRPGYRDISIPILGRSWTLRLLKQPTNTMYDRSTSFSLTFVEDMPVRKTDYQAAAGGGVNIPGSVYRLDGASFEQYGIVVKSGQNDVLRSSAVRQNLTRSFSTSDGQLYDVGQVVLSEKEVTFKCCLIADSIIRFWNCYDAFFNDLIKPGVRNLYYDENGETYKCYYNKTASWQLVSLSARVVVEFDLTLVFTSCQAGATEYLLATEAGEFITTEDDYFIDLSRNVPAATSLQPVLPSETTPEEPVEIRKRKISEMPATSSLDNLILPAVDRMTNRNVHVPIESLGGGTIGNLGELINVDPTVDEAIPGSIFVKGEKWQSIAPVLAENSDFDQMLLPVYHRQLGWMFIPVASLPGGGGDIVTSGFPYTFPLILA